MFLSLHTTLAHCVPQRLTPGAPHPAAASPRCPSGPGRCSSGPREGGGGASLLPFFSALFTSSTVSVPSGPSRSSLVPALPSLPRPGPARSDPTRPPSLRPQGQCGAAAPSPVPGHGHQRPVHQLQEGGREPCEVSFGDTEGTSGGCSRCQRLAPSSPLSPRAGWGCPAAGRWLGRGRESSFLCK